MEFGVFGKGKTGQEVIKLLDTKHVYDSNKLPTPKDSLDVLIVFIPPKAFTENLDLLLSLSCPLVIGTTGVEWTSELQTKIKQNKRTWIYAANFSLGMLIMRKALNEVKSLISILDSPIISIVETHHTDKKDSPSGTALLWKEWIGSNQKIESIRHGDVIGIHRATIKTDLEQMTFTHEATDRKLFAKGAVWCANIITQSKISSGLHSFEEIVDSYLKDKNV